MPFPSFPLFLPTPGLPSCLSFILHFFPAILPLFIASIFLHSFVPSCLAYFLSPFLPLSLPSFFSVFSLSPPFPNFLPFFNSFFSGCLHPSFLPDSNTDLWHACRKSGFALLWTTYEWSYVGRVDIRLSGAEQWNLDVMMWPSSCSGFFFPLQPFLCLYVLHMKAISIMLHSDGNEIILMAFAQLSEKYN